MADDPASGERLLNEAFGQIADAVLPLDGELRLRAHAMLGAFLGIEPEAGASRPAGHRSPPPTQIAPREPPAPKDFLLMKQPSTDVERVACLAYYLAHYRGIQHFKTIDISKLNTEAAQRKFANAATSVNNATRDGYLATVVRGTKQLAAEGEQYVDALPDRTAAKAIRTRKARRQRRQSSGGKPTPATSAHATSAQDS